MIQHRIVRMRVTISYDEFKEHTKEEMVEMALSQLKAMTAKSLIEQGQAALDPVLRSDK